MEEHYEDFENPCYAYTKEDLRQYLISLGFVELDDGSDYGMKPKSADYKCFYEFESNNPQFSVRFCVGKAADGTIPQVQYTFFINKDTDKVQEVRYSSVKYYTEEEIAANQ